MFPAVFPPIKCSRARGEDRRDDRLAETRRDAVDCFGGRHDLVSSLNG